MVEILMGQYRCKKKRLCGSKRTSSDGIDFFSVDLNSPFSPKTGQGTLADESVGLGSNIKSFPIAGNNRVE